MSKQEPGCCEPLSEDPLAAVQATELSAMFKALGDPVRLRLLSMIASGPDAGVCVCELTPAFELSQPTISHHLKLLRLAGLVDCERRGTWVYYWVRPETTERMAAMLSSVSDRRPVTA
jgi:ArsR family transcriptional regulator